jgi:hypothetical protein
MPPSLTLPSPALYYRTVWRARTLCLVAAPTITKLGSLPSKYYNYIVYEATTPLSYYKLN